MPLPLNETFAIRLVQSPGQPMMLKTSHSNGKGGMDYDLQGLYVAMLKDALRLVEAQMPIGGQLIRTDEALTLADGGLGMVPIRA